MYWENWFNFILFMVMDVWWYIWQFVKYEMLSQFFTIFNTDIKSIPVLKNETSPVVWNQVSFCCIDSVIVEKNLWSGMSFTSICCERTYLPSQHWILWFVSLSDVGLIIEPKIICWLSLECCEDKNVLLKRVSDRNQNKNGHI